MSEVFGKIILERESQFMNRLKSYKVFINDTQQNTIGNGKTEEYQVPAGQNKIVCKVNWCSSNELAISVNPGEKVFLKVSSGVRFFWPVYTILMIAILTRVFINRKQEMGGMINIISLFIISLSALYYLYYITIGRKSYLDLEVDVNNIFSK